MENVCPAPGEDWLGVGFCSRARAQFLSLGLLWFNWFYESFALSAALCSSLLSNKFILHLKNCGQSRQFLLPMIYILWAGKPAAGWARLLFSKNNIQLKLPRERILQVSPHEMWPRSSRSSSSSCEVRFLLIENVFNLNPFQRQKSLALNFEGRVQISQELKAMEIAPKSLFRSWGTGIVFWSRSN